MNLFQKCYIHVDLDAFFASVEQMDHPEWKDKPVIVGGLPGDRRSVVSTASYEARKFGVHSAMPTQEAYRLCPNGIFTHGNMRRYWEISEKVMKILSNYTPSMIQFSIDEAALDITGTEKLFGKPIEIAEKIKSEIKDKIGLTISIGIAPTQYLSKIASEVNKPNGIYEILPGNEIDFMMNLPLSKVWGIGDKTLKKLNNAGFYKTSQIYEKSLDSLKIILGEGTATFLYNVLRGNEIERKETQSHSISNETTFPFDLFDLYTIETSIMELSQCVMFRLLKEKGYSKTVCIKIRYEDFSTTTVQQTFMENITTLDDLFSKACSIFRKKYNTKKGVRLIGIALQNIENENLNNQGMLFDFGDKKKQEVEKAILKIGEKYPEIKITKARLIQTPKKQ